jgi:hypothetical protein
MIYRLSASIILVKGLSPHGYLAFQTRGEATALISTEKFPAL